MALNCPSVINRQNRAGVTALMLACKAAAGAEVERGLSEPRVDTPNGLTPPTRSYSSTAGDDPWRKEAPRLTKKAEHVHFKLIELLLESGADPIIQVLNTSEYLLLRVLITIASSIDKLQKMLVTSQYRRYLNYY